MYITHSYPFFKWIVTPICSFCHSLLTRLVYCVVALTGFHLATSQSSQPVGFPSNGLNYWHYHQSVTSLPADFNTLTPVTSGTTSNFIVTVSTVPNQFLLKFEGFLLIETNETYTFYTTSDDGSRLFIDDVLVVNNNFVQAPTERSGTIALTRGVHKIEVQFFEQGGGEHLSVHYASPTIAKQAVPANKLFPTDPGIMWSYNGKIGIGLTDPDEELTVNGTIHAKEAKLDLQGALVPDYVFAKDYQLRSLDEVSEYINRHHHLPEIPSAKEIEESGLHLKEMNLLLLKKVEELTLYLIEERESRMILEQKINQLEKQLNH